MLGNLSVPGRPTYLDNSRQGHIFAVDAGKHFFDIFFLSPSLGDDMIG